VRTQVSFPWLVDLEADGPRAPNGAAIDLRLAKKGRREPLGALLEQARYSIGLARQHAAPLAKSGWPRTRTDGLEADVVLLEGVIAAHADKGKSTRARAQAEQRAIDDAKRFLRALRAALPIVLREHPGASVDVSALRIGHELRRSVDRIRAYLGVLHEVLPRLDGALAPYFGGKKPSTLAGKLRAALEQADEAHEAERKARTPITWQAYEARGRVIEAIEDLHRVARIAFDANAEVRGKFHRKILDAARKTRPRKPEGEPAEEG
jgi:hypothetical protein